VKNKKEQKKDRKYQRPDFLDKLIDQQIYEKWLNRKARGHFNRDKKHDSIQSTCQEYKKAIHEAVYDSNGLDAYTGKDMKWELLATFDRVRIADLPTVDHVRDAKKQPSFKICSWRVNDAKSDLTLDEFVSLCGVIIKFYEKSKN